MAAKQTSSVSMAAQSNQNAARRAVFRSAEDLYAQLPVRDVVRVLAKTKEDAEKKREELRDLVGRRYHDLIDSADAIINMNDTVVGFEKLLLTIESSAGALLADTGAAKQTSKQLGGVKRKQEEKSSESTTILDERQKIDLLLRAPSEIWSALASGEELQAAKLFLDADKAAKQLKLVSEPQGSNSHDARGSGSDTFRKACEELQLNGSELADCIRLAQAANEDRELCGEWQLKFPFLVSQARLLRECRMDIVKTCSLAFAERQISASRVERVMEALLALGEISNPFNALLQARSQALRTLVSGEEDSVFAIAELASRTCHDAAWMKARFQSPNADKELNVWVDTVAAPVARSFADAVCSKTTTMSALASLQRSLKESIRKIDALPEQPETNTPSLLNDDDLFKRLFADSFQERASQLLASSYEQTIRKTKRILNACGSAADGKRNDYALKAFHVLEQGLNSVERDAADVQQTLHSNGTTTLHPQQKKLTSILSTSHQWLSDLVTWLEQRPTPGNGRFAELLLSLLRNTGEAGGAVFEKRLEALSKQSVEIFAESVTKRLGDEFEAKAATLPWSKEGRQGSSVAVGGWSVDPVHGELPTVASWPAAELCFTVARELDAFTDPLHRGGPICTESDLKARRVVGDTVWRRVHTVYSQMSKAAPGADGKLQAAFDLEFCAAALVEGTRAPLPFTQGGVDVYACADALRVRARAFASSSRLLHSSWVLNGGAAKLGGDQGAVAVYETKVGGHNLLSVVEPVPRFALLPMPQKRSASTPRLLHRSSSQTSGDYVGESASKVTTTSSSATSTKQQSTGVGLGRVLGWLS